MGNRREIILFFKKKKKGGEEKKWKSGTKSLKITASFPPSCDLLAVTTTTLPKRNALLLECHQQSPGCVGFMWFGVTLLIFRSLGNPVERKTTNFSCVSFHSIGLPRNLVGLFILLEWVFWVWREPILDFSKILPQLQPMKRFLAQGHLAHWGICWILLDLSVLPAVIWLTLTKLFLRLKAWTEWALWTYFHYFLCISYQSVENDMHSQEKWACLFLTKWFRHRFHIHTCEHKVEEV